MNVTQYIMQICVERIGHGQIGFTMHMEHPGGTKIGVKIKLIPIFVSSSFSESSDNFGI